MPSAGSDIEVLLPMGAFYSSWHSTPERVKAQPFPAGVDHGTVLAYCIGLRLRIIFICVF